LTEEKHYCVVCAWRENCQKKYAFQTSGSYFCKDYCRDLTLPRDEKVENEK
jgi:hypothetical protein